MNMNFDFQTLFARMITLIIAFTIHEFSHAWVATKLGDTTAQDAGRLTLNPLVHLDPFGTLLLMVAGFGWAKPVPINPYRLQQKNKAGVVLVSIAGPISNLLLALLGAILVHLLRNFLPGATLANLNFLSYFLAVFISTNIILALFNMLPIPPLDGEKVLNFLLPGKWQGAIAPFRRYGSLIILALFVLGPSFGLNIFDWLIGKPANAIFNFLVGF